ncbi:hypothetical protein Slin14017_G068610 [Septoria linicola]|nr:hypothetical protein Slin14017_G068610 [Septoria linicola]
MKFSTTAILTALTSSFASASAEPLFPPHQASHTHTPSRPLMTLTLRSYTPHPETTPTSTSSYSEIVKPLGRCTSQDGDCEMWHTVPHFPHYTVSVNRTAATASPTMTNFSRPAFGNSTLSKSTTTLRANSTLSTITTRSGDWPGWQTYTHTNGWNATHTHTLSELPPVTLTVTGTSLRSSTSTEAMNSTSSSTSASSTSASSTSASSTSVPASTLSNSTSAPSNPLSNSTSSSQTTSTSSSISSSSSSPEGKTSWIDATSEPVTVTAGAKTTPAVAGVVSSSRSAGEKPTLAPAGIIASWGSASTTASGKPTLAVAGIVSAWGSASTSSLR